MWVRIWILTYESARNQTNWRGGWIEGPVPKSWCCAIHNWSGLTTPAKVSPPKVFEEFANAQHQDFGTSPFFICSSEGTGIQTNIHFDAKIDRNTEGEQIHSTMTLLSSLNTEKQMETMRMWTSTFAFCSQCKYTNTVTKTDKNRVSVITINTVRQRQFRRENPRYLDIRRTSLPAYDRHTYKVR